MKKMRTIMLGAVCALGLVTPACSGGGGDESSGSSQASSSSTGVGGAGGQGGSGGAAPSSVIWVGAHPDDELYAAPWLGHLCIEQGSACTFVVMTHGEAGKCKLATGCAPDLETMRVAELTQSAALFGANLVHWDLGDGTSGDAVTVANNWVTAAGGSQKMLADLTALFQKADRIVTFDPRHGDSCHPDHRAAGLIVLSAVADMGAAAPPVTLVASKGIIAPAAPEDSAVWTFDASTLSTKIGTDHWAFLISVLETHKSQFTADEVAMLKAVPAASRKTFLLEASAAIKDDPHYAGVCP